MRAIIQINSIYYPGWGATLDRIVEEIGYQNTDGLIRIYIPAGKHTLYAQFRETPFRFLVDCLSCISLLVYIVFVYMMYKKGNT